MQIGQQSNCDQPHFQRVLSPRGLDTVNNDTEGKLETEINVIKGRFPGYQQSNV